jgi:glycine dehydrogenase subunit 1
MSFVPLTEAERDSMLETLGLPSTDALFEAIPESLRFPQIDIGPALTEMEVTAQVEALAARNRPAYGTPFFLGAGAYRHFIPAAIGSLMSRSEFATSYTPYQPEVSQGTLQMSFEFQSLVCDLTGMDTTNASVYDGASAVAEAALMALRLTGRDRIVLSAGVHPHYRQALEAYVRPRGVDLVTSQIDIEDGVLRETGLLEAIDDRTACVIVSQPTFFGEIRDLARAFDAVHTVGGLAIEAYNPTSLGMLKPPGAWGADIAAAEGQPLGISLSYGGPYVGLLSCRRDLVRQMPGRIVGMTKDGEGRRGFVLTLQAREQHIRREKATSNICTSQTLISLGVASYLALLGPTGLRDVAESCWRTTRYAADQLAMVPGVEIITPRPFFHEFALRTPLPAAEINRRLLERGIVGGYELGRSYPGLEDALLLCCTEVTTRDQIDQLVSGVKIALESRIGVRL